MPDEHDPDRLQSLDARIGALKEARDPGSHQDGQLSMANMAIRMVIELVVGLLIGLGIGYGLDAFFGTQPFMMVLFIFLGFAAGVKTMLRTAREPGKDQAAEAVDDERD